MDPKLRNSSNLTTGDLTGHEFGFCGFSDDETKTYSKSDTQLSRASVLTQAISPAFTTTLTQ